MKATLQIIVIARLLFSVTTRASKVVVCKSCDLSTIKQGIALARDHDTVLIKKGIYKEYNLLIAKPITLLGQDYPVIDGELQGGILRIISDNVIVDGLSLINVGSSYTQDFAAVRVVKSKGFIIKNLVLEKTVFWYLSGKIQPWQNQ